MRGAAITLEGVSKTYDNGLLALQATDLGIDAGEFISIVGPSGCGKSTLLRIVADLVQPTQGQCLRPGEFETGFVFQEAALLPWRTVQKNAELLMELEGYRAPDCAARAAEALKLVGLAGFEKSYPHELSGGMRMRLSLARALALRPALLLLDEPLAAVDELTRDVLQEELSALWKEAGFTAMMVTHNVHEAVFLSTRVVVMSARPGRVLRVIDVPFDFPRAPELRSSPAFAALTGEVTAALRHPVAEQVSA
ncbi:MAG: ABC transporter ATP-binding protein [Hydrogenophaga sp.]|uniref:ABC transporter ATP-binding protein n=1 Tax=Hydrogenophaga sp. TaxID=1904254 RepID=UPI001D777FAC|nr:ABC transporter ATP-binding protein [Hydrogenophaga sp.]MBX3611151.1 ABC transporter ATP-binding protein [Hydrogenophaga sp.]